MELTFELNFIVTYTEKEPRKMELVYGWIISDIKQKVMQYLLILV